MTANYAQVAAAVYQACNHFDPYLPTLSPELAKAWGRQFEKFQFSIDDLMKAVDRVYEDHGSGYRPLPKDITDAARAIRRERCERESADERRAREDARDADLERRNQLATAVARLAESKAVDHA